MFWKNDILVYGYPEASCLNFQKHQKLGRLLTAGSAVVFTCFKPHQTLRQILVALKDRTKVENQTGVAYRIQCEVVTKTTVKEQIKEFTPKIANNLSAVAEHYHKDGNKISWCAER